MKTSTVRKRKSEAFTPEEYKMFKQYVKSFSTKLDCMAALQITMPTLDRIMLKGTGRPDTIEKIRVAMQSK